MEDVKNISKEEYEHVLDLVPIICVDLVIMNDNGEVLVVKRQNEPGKGEWWIPGGRLLKNESIEECARRKAKEELGLDLEPIEVLGSGETIFNNSPFEGVNSHTVNFFVLMSELGNQEIKPDESQHTEWDFVSDIGEDADPYMIEIFDTLNEYFELSEE